MAATVTSPPPEPTSPNTHKLLPRAPHSHERLGVDVKPGPTAPRIRDAPVSPVRVNFQADNWVHCNANIEQVHGATAEFVVADRTRQRSQPQSPTNPHLPPHSPVLQSPTSPYSQSSRPRDHDRQPLSPASTVSSRHAPQLASPIGSGSLGDFDLGFSPNSNFTTPAPEDISGITANDTTLQDDNRNSRESDGTTSTRRQHVSKESSASTSASSISGINENSECRDNGSAESSLIEGHMPRNQSVPLFQYHHQDQYPPERVASAPNMPDVRSASNPDLAAGAGINRHLTPSSSGFLQRGPLQRPPSVYSTYSDFGARSRSPGLMPGKACLVGDLGEKRYREGIKWMKLAAEAADSIYNSAPYQLACLYETGYGDDVFKDENYAAELFTQAAELGHPEANFRMGEAYEHGKLGCPRDPALSVHFYTGAAEKGHAAAMMGLCAWYMVGAEPILEKDEEEAYEWARRSAELGFVKAQYAVGYFTEMGIGCRRDILEANVWYVKAADSGDDRARQRIAIIQAAVSGGTPMEVAPPRNGKAKKGDDKDCILM
ncbi:hypothetical protein BN1723_009786 [Verticillium longisporum]|uniref:HCP-like protein n=1 Tax=Verticillium longisporum TaxID=100787 RepID=A0A0G4KTT2_VERLO|nr:hypothetical protein BN1723_009786 [Verticillium longisporum]